MSNKPFIILILLIVVVFLLTINIYIDKLKNIENFTTITSNATESENNIDYNKNPAELKKMFKTLEDAEKKCEILESQQLQREEKQIMRNNDRIYKQLQEQDKQIHELKEIVKYLTIEKKRRDKINNSCKSSKQRKLNEQYNIVKSLNDSGLVRDNSLKLDLNISDSDKLKKLISNIKSLQKKQEKKEPKRKYSKCRVPRGNKVNIDKIGLDKCYQCDKEKIGEIESDIYRDYS